MNIDLVEDWIVTNELPISLANTIQTSVVAFEQEVLDCINDEDKIDVSVMDSPKIQRAKERCFSELFSLIQEAGYHHADIPAAYMVEGFESKIAEKLAL